MTSNCWWLGGGVWRRGTQILGGDLTPTGPRPPLCPRALRVEWAQVRQAFFGSGKNKAALDAIERAAFFVALDEESHRYDPEDEASLSLYGKALLHGSCYNRYHTPSSTAGPTPPTSGSSPAPPTPRAPPPAPTPPPHLRPLQVVRQVLHSHRFQERPAGPQHRTRVGRRPYHRAPLGGSRPWERSRRAGAGRGRGQQGKDGLSA